MTDQFSLTLTGQAMIRGDVRVHAPEAAAEISRLIDAEFAFSNYEAAVYDPTKGESTRSGRFASPPESVDALAELGFNLMSLANNHSFDCAAAGIVNTLDAAQRTGIAYAGTGRDPIEAGRPAVLRKRQSSVALIALASGLVLDGRVTSSQPGVNELRVDGQVPNAEDATRILASVREAAAEADLVVVSHHNHHFPGVERPEDFKQLLLSELPARLAPPAWLQTWAHELVDAGADVVAMHGPPFLHGLEIYNGTPIFYSLGNFIFQVPPESIHLEEPIMWESVVARLNYHNGELGSIRIQPIGMNKVGVGLPNPHDQFDVNQYHLTRGLPRAVEGAQARFLLERFARFSEPYGTHVEIDGDFAEVHIPTVAGR